jgi:phenylacetate-CoA ligase
VYGFGRLPAIPLALGVPVRPRHLARWRDACLASLIRHACRNVPFVRASFRSVGLDAREIREVADLPLLPVTSKADLQEAGVAQVLARNVRVDRLLDRSTSGSTGERTLVKRTWFEERLLNSFRRRALRAYGLTPTERLAVLLFHRAEDPRDDQTLLRLAQRAGLFRKRVFDALADPLVVRAVASFRPHVVVGMTSAIARVADDASSSTYAIRPRFVVTGGELLTEPLRARIAALGSPIYDIYGCNEVNIVAWQCPNGIDGYHVCDDAHIVEVLDADGKAVPVGGWGEVVVTSLFSYAMPFVRFRLGDLAVRGPDGCACGAPFSTLLAVRGRTIDCFPLGDGKPLHPWEILNAIKPHMGWVKQFQLVQSSPGDIELRVLPRRTPAADELESMAAAARARLAGRARFAITLVATIATGPAGKSRLFVPFAADAAAPQALLHATPSANVKAK